MSNEHDDFLPSASLKTLRRRSQIITSLRAFFEGEGYWHVETPIVSHDIVVDAYLDPVKTSISLGGKASHELFLQTSPEFAMKRLLAAGAEAIYQICPAIRDGERGAHHNPEFTMLEWYRQSTSYHEQMDFTERLIRCTASDVQDTWGIGSFGEDVFGRTSYTVAFERAIGTPVYDKTTSELREIAGEQSIHAPESLSDQDHDGWLNLILAERVEPTLGRDVPEFIYDYPASQSALSETTKTAPAVAQRFELYWKGIELCNGYQELLDASELERRNGVNNELRISEGRQPLPSDSRLLSAMRHGLPRSSGVALGLDRLIMLLLKKKSIDEVIAFPIERA